MNNILQLKGKFQQQSISSTFGPIGLPVGTSVESNHLIDLKNELVQILHFWQGEHLINGALVSAHYYHVVAKSNRIKVLLCKGSSNPNDAIRGSKFSSTEPTKHIFTYYIKLDAIEESIHRLETCRKIVDREYNGTITCEDIEALNRKEKQYKYTEEISKSKFLSVIVDAHYVEHFSVERDDEQISEHSIVTIYKTDVAISQLLSNLGIDMIDAKKIDDTTIRLNPDELEILRDKAPYLIAMKTYDLNKVTQEEISECNYKIDSIPSPSKEPVVGVIDTLFYQDVYFKDWVTYCCKVDDSIETTIDDCYHGTAVSSIIVDGPTLNPDLDDGCGRFRVKHFGVSTQGKFSSFTVMKLIKDIVAQNRDIKVWNLSLGSAFQIHKNFISPEAAELDKIQSEYDVVFVVAGTNKEDDSPEEMHIGAPADSLNAVVVNSVDFEGKPASYHRVGPVLSFFHKPDLSYYGGDRDRRMKVCTPYGVGFVSGTSFAAPWISRKMAYLIYTMGFSREVAKALLIDSAAGWNREEDASNTIGYGIVPKRIENIVKTQDDEIRFIMTGSSDSYETYTYEIPIPIVNDKQPFFARATLCYFPKCVRNQGVDYTSTEMDIHFGRVKQAKGKPQIASVNANMQDDNGHKNIPEENARRLYRKWDNIKLISDVIKDSPKPRKVYDAGLWGLSIKTKERLLPKNGRGLQFGVVVTLKEMNGENRIDDFKKLCMVRGWIVNEIDIDNRFNVFNKAEDEISLD